MTHSSQWAGIPVAATRNSPPSRRKIPMFNTPPSTTNKPASQRTLTPNLFWKSSGIVITPERLSGPITKPVRPTKYIAPAMSTPIVAPANPLVNPNCAVYMTVTSPNSVAAREAMPRFTSMARPATAPYQVPISVESVTLKLGPNVSAAVARNCKYPVSPSTP